MLPLVLLASSSIYFKRLLDLHKGNLNLCSRRVLQLRIRQAWGFEYLLSYLTSDLQASFLTSLILSSYIDKIITCLSKMLYRLNEIKIYESRTRQMIST